MIKLQFVYNSENQMKKKNDFSKNALHKNQFISIDGPRKQNKNKIKILETKLSIEKRAHILWVIMSLSCP